MPVGNFLVFEGTGFNKDLIKKLTIDEFLASKAYDHIWPKLTNKTDRKKRFRELYKLATLEPK